MAIGKRQKAFENFIARITVGPFGFIIGLIIDLFVASILIFSTTILAVSSLVCLALDWPTFAMLFGIALLAITLTARGHCWSQGQHLVDPEILDLIVAAEVTYLILIKQGFTIFNCLLVREIISQS